MVKSLVPKSGFSLKLPSLKLTASFSPENWWLEDDHDDRFLLGRCLAYFQVHLLLVSWRVRR